MRPKEFAMRFMLLAFAVATGAPAMGAEEFQNLDDLMSK